LNTFKTILYKWLIIVLVLVVAGVWFVFHELSGANFGFGPAVQKLPNGSPELVLSDADLSTLRGVRLVPKSDPVVQTAGPVVSVTSLRLINHTGNVVTVGLHLSAVPGTGNYPVIRVSFQSDRGTVRATNFSPGEYAHGTYLSEEDVRLTLVLHEGETGCTAQVIPAGTQAGA
jgi:hypothetical protein